MKILVGEDSFLLDVFCFAKNANWLADAVLSPTPTKDLSLQNIGQVENYLVQKDDEFCIAIKDVNRRIEVANFLKEKNARFVKIIHPTCEVSELAEIGDGVIVAPFCLISADSKIGEFSIVESHSLVGHNASIGSFSNIGSHCDLTGFCEVGNRCEIGDACALIPNVKIADDVKIKENSTLVSSKRKAGTY